MLIRLLTGHMARALCLCLGLSACGADDGADTSGRNGGTGGAGGGAGAFGTGGFFANEVPAGTRSLGVIGTRALTLEYGEEVTIEVELSDRGSGDPIVGTHVSFSLQGPQDATLGALSVATDGQGVARNTLMAGELTSTFTLEVSAPGAKAISIAVAVSDAGFGRLSVVAPYAGERLVHQRRITVLDDVACLEAMAGDGALMALLEDAEVEADPFLLPASRAYTVTVTAEGTDGTVLASACKSGVEIIAETLTVAELSFDDLPLMARGTYDLLASLQAEAPALTVSETFAAAAALAIDTDRQDELNTVDAEARLLLDTLEDQLRADAAENAALTALADALAAERATPQTPPGPDAALQVLLGDAMVGPHGALLGLSASLREALITPSLGMEILVEGQMSWQPVSVSSAALDGQGNRVQVDLTGQDSIVVEALRLPEGDGISVQDVRFELPWGGLGARAARKLAADGLGGFSPALRAAFGCDVFAAYVVEMPELQGMCDADCAARACGTALGAVLEAAAGASEALDLDRPTVTLGVELSLYDDTGDLGVERMDASQLQGLWEPAEPQGDSDAFSGSAQGEVLISARDDLDAP